MKLTRNAARDALSLLACLFMTLVSAQPLLALEASAAPDATTWYVSTGGLDSQACGSAGAPCRSIQYAINRAGDGDTIMVAAGTFVYTPAAETCQGFGTTGVLCIVQKSLSIKGGYPNGDWSAPSAATPTIIDGQDQRRGAFIVSTDPGSRPARVTFEALTFSRGRATSIPARGGDDTINAFGGGMYVDHARVTLRNVRFDANTAVGSAADRGGAGSGGGIAFTLGDGVSTLDNVTFVNNRAVGGNGATRGGYAIGGGLYTYRSAVTVNATVFDGNRADGGDASGPGYDSGDEHADAQGGAAAAQLGSQLQLANVQARNNVARGGDTPNGSAGGGFGGAFFAEGRSDLPTTLALADGVISRNLARGGDGINDRNSRAALAWGGGVQTFNVNTILDRLLIVDNDATGGNSPVVKASAGGGGVALVRLQGNATASVTNTIVAANRVNLGSGSDARYGGGGGGVWLQGVQATLTHCTIADNAINSPYTQGQGVLLLGDGAQTGAAVTIQYSIIARHTNGAGLAALHVKPGNSVVLREGLYASNTRNDNAGGVPGPAGNFLGLGSMLSASSPGFVSPGAPALNYHLTAGSPARDRALSSTTAVDIDRQSRPWGAARDIGADESVNASFKLYLPGVIK